MLAASGCPAKSIIQLSNGRLKNDGMLAVSNLGRDRGHGIRFPGESEANSFFNCPTATRLTENPIPP